MRLIKQRAGNGP